MVLAKFPEYNKREVAAVAEEQQLTKRAEIEAEMNAYDEEYDEVSGF